MMDDFEEVGSPPMSSSWESVPVALRSALKTLAETSAAVTRRLSQVEGELAAEKLKTTTTLARLLSRVEALEKTPEPPEELTRGLEAIRRQVDAARADAAATRAVATWRGLSEPLLNAAVAEAVDKASPRIAADAAKQVNIVVPPSAPIAKPDARAAEALEVAHEALDAARLLQADLRTKASREECRLAARDEAALKIAPLQAELNAAIAGIHSLGDNLLPVSGGEEEMPRRRTSSSDVVGEAVLREQILNVASEVRRKKAEMKRDVDSLRRDLTDGLQKVSATSSALAERVRTLEITKSDNALDDLKAMVRTDLAEVRAHHTALQETFDKAQSENGEYKTQTTTKLDDLTNKLVAATTTSPKKPKPPPLPPRPRQQPPVVDQKAVEAVVLEQTHQAVDKAVTGLEKRLATDTKRKVATALTAAEAKVLETAKAAAVEAAATYMKQNRQHGVAASIIDNRIADRIASCEPLKRRGRWLWRSGRVAKGGWIPWDIEAVNTAQDSFDWSPDAPTKVVTNLPGLFKITVAAFTQADATIQFYVSGEPVLTLEPGAMPRRGAAEPLEGAVPNAHALRRGAHSAGECACIAIDEYVALPVRSSFFCVC